MSEEMKKDVMETAEAVETAAPAETMDDYAAELEESYKTLEGKQPVYEAEEDPAAEKWQNFAQMMEDKTVFDVKVKEAVKGGLVAFVDDVRAFIPASHISTHYVEKLEDMVGFLLPQFVEEGKSMVVVAIGCTGGQHRSVAMTHALAEYVRSLGYQVSENHRDMTRA